MAPEQGPAIFCGLPSSVSRVLKRVLLEARCKPCFEITLFGGAM